MCCKDILFIACENFRIIDMNYFYFEEEMALLKWGCKFYLNDEDTFQMNYVSLGVYAAKDMEELVNKVKFS